MAKKEVETNETRLTEKYHYINEVLLHLEQGYEEDGEIVADKNINNILDDDEKLYVYNAIHDILQQHSDELYNKLLLVDEDKYKMY